MYRGARDNRLASSPVAEDEGTSRQERPYSIAPASGLRGLTASERPREMLSTPELRSDRGSSTNTTSMPPSGPVSGPTSGPTSGPVSGPTSGRFTGPDSHVRPTSVTRLHETAFGRIELDRQNLLVRFIRSDQPFATVAEVDHESNEIERVLEKLRRSKLLVDLRTLVLTREDPAIDAAMVRFRQRLLRGSERAVILVRTAIGALQVKRHMREDGLNVEVFQNEEEALAHLEGIQPDSASRASCLPPAQSRRFARRG